jgi:DNA integrity scanning protein DisA with diadenylate cyclase activity
LALFGLAILAGFYLLADKMALQLTTWIFQGFFAVLVILLVVVFQDDLRRFFEQIAVLGLRRRPASIRPDTVSVLVQTLEELAHSHTGALVIIPGREPIERHLKGGILSDALLSKALILSIFDTKTPGHDGALLVHGERLDRFGVHLPLSEDHQQLGAGGTRHAAALGLAECSDAFCLVVSEERGTLSLAHQGRLQPLTDPLQAQQALRDFLTERGLNPGRRVLTWPRVRRIFFEAGTGFALALVAWITLVPGSTFVKTPLSVEVRVENMPQGYTLESVTPPQVKITFSGMRRDFLLAQAEDIHLTINALLVDQGRRTFAALPEAVQHPPGLEVLHIAPEKVRLSVQRTNVTLAP